MKKEGYPFTFDSSACKSCGGKCCIGERGFIWVSPFEKRNLAEHLMLSLEEFTKKYVDRLGQRESFKEVQIDKNNYACIFFDTEKRQCSIYEYRPFQCRTFPFWSYYKEKPTVVAKECPGIQLLSSD